MTAARHSSSDTSPPISISDRTVVRLPLLVLVSLLGFAGSIALGYGNLKTDIESSAQERAHLAQRQEEQAERIKALERTIADVPLIKNDVQWIRETMENRGGYPTATRSANNP